MNDTVAAAQTAAQKYRELHSTKEEPIVDVKLPSGAVFKFTRPSKFALLFGLGELPTAATNVAAHKWMDEGAIETAEHSIPADQKQRDQNIRAGLLVRDRILLLSYDPKIVVGPAQNPNEISTDEISDDDLDYLFRWMSAGGETSLMLGKFPGRQQHHPVAGSVRKKRRAKTK